MTDTTATTQKVYTAADIPDRDSTLVYNTKDTVTNLVGGIINYDGINTTGGLFNAFDTRGGGKSKKSKAAKTSKPKTSKVTKVSKVAKVTKVSKVAKVAKPKTSKVTKVTKVTKPKTPKVSKVASLNDVKIPKKIMDELYNNINKMYNIYNKKNKSNGMKGGSGIPDSYFNTTDLALGSFIPTAYDPSAFNRSSLLSNFGSSLT